jgi:hypothetical protein
VQRAAKKSKHRVDDACSTVCAVLALNPHYGLVVKGHPALRKMRVKAPRLTAGKSGGYRLIYATAFVDECHHFALLALYYKGDREDLDPDDYSELKSEAAAILGNVIDYSWSPWGDS